MVDREKVLAVLAKRFPGATVDQMAAAANAIVGLDDEWEEVTEREEQLGYLLPCPAGRARRCLQVFPQARRVQGVPLLGVHL